VNLLVKIAVAWLANVAALWVADALLDGLEIEGWGPLLLAALVLAVLNMLVRPILIILSIPFLLLTLGLFLLVINFFVLWLTGVIVSGFDISGFWTYFGAVVILWIVNAIIDRLLDRSGVAV
jgi:putative membrane protein